MITLVTTVILKITDHFHNRNCKKETLRYRLTDVVICKNWYAGSFSEIFLHKCHRFLFFMNISNILPKLLVTDVKQIPDIQTYQNWTKELNCFKVLYSVYSYMLVYEYANKWSIAEFLTLFSRNVNVNKCEKTCVEYIKKFKVSNLNFKQITRLFAIYISFIFWILETFKIGNTCKSNNLDLSIQISIYIRHAEFCNGS